MVLLGPDRNDQLPINMLFDGRNVGKLVVKVAD
jgi:NADPH-dependent curcumin reductase CurA